MQMMFLGANHEVTGSRTLLTVGNTHLLVDCGMEQGKNHYENAAMPVPPSQIDIVLLTHAHIDHSGLLPQLFRQGFRGKVYATRETCSLCEIMLRDSAHIQESEAEWKNRKALRAGTAPVQPLYTLDDAEGVLRLFRPLSYRRKVSIAEGIDITFYDVGHLLGSASILLNLEESGQSRSVLFSGDVGNVRQPIIRDPQPIDGADFLVVEATYGDRLHAKSTVNTTAQLARYIQETLDRGGNVIIPSFAVGRTQEILYYIREIQEKGLVQGHGDFPVYVDSPLANEATAVFLQCGMDCLDEDAQMVMRRGKNPLVFPGLHTFVTVEESKALNADSSPKVIIASSGMCDAGRIKHHLKHNLWREESLILFVGYQSNGTLGRAIYEGAKKVKLFGEEIHVRARVALLAGTSGHADQSGLLHYVRQMSPHPREIFVNHSEDCAAQAMLDLLEADGYTACAPYSGSVYDLSQCQWRNQAQPVPFRRTPQAPANDTAYAQLLERIAILQSHAKTLRNAPCSELTRLTAEIDALLAKSKQPMYFV